jgi:hypothetical protein
MRLSMKDDAALGQRRGESTDRNFKLAVGISCGGKQRRLNARPFSS